MGVPALFRSLSQKYPKIISPVIEEEAREIDGVAIPIDMSGPNPNDEEFDNLYLDMNGIVHPCSHPEDRPPPQDEEEMMREVFKYTERVVNMVRPRKLLMIAVDGVAPRAKMNQQRSRRFRSAKEAAEKDADKLELLKMLKSQGGGTVQESTNEAMNKKTWDSNVITPGTPFMDILANSLRYWCAYKLNTDPAWAKMKVIISDATVPGEGEHKIMEFVRSQRSSPDHDPNTRHVIYGLDADLIMLGLATHEPHFRVLREDVFFQEAGPRKCHMCGQTGHQAAQCTGKAAEKNGEFDEKDKPIGQKPFIWLHVAVLREYLEAELYVPSQPFRFDLERAIDDWVFLCFFVGNDFLPHLPSLEIREGGIETLVSIWRENIPFMGGYLTKDGHVDLERAQFILDGLAKQEDGIFRRRRQAEERREANNKRRKLQDEQASGNRGAGNQATPSGHGTGKERNAAFASGPIDFPLMVPGNMVTSIGREAKAVTYNMAMNRDSAQANLANKSAAAALKAKLLNAQSESPSTPVKGEADAGTPTSGSALGKRKAELMEEDENGTPGRNTPAPSTPGTPATGGDEAVVDDVKLWEPGYADRYYEQKFQVDPKDHEFRKQVGRAYVEGLAWVLLYYFQGCPSWEWYYPYHYAPFAADFQDLANIKLNFQKGRTFKPFEQLMGVLPAASRHAIPELFHPLMTEPDSPIIDFYPEDFPIDLNGKKFAWQGVALLPFIDPKRLLVEMEKLYPQLEPAQAARNTMGRDVLIVSSGHAKLYDDMSTKFYSKKQVPEYRLNPKISEGLSGKVEKDENFFTPCSLVSPLASSGLPDLDDDNTIRAHYDMPTSKHTHKSMLLRGVQLPPKALNQADIEGTKARAAGRGGRGGGGHFGNNGGGRGNYQNGGGNSYRGRGGSNNNYQGGSGSSNNHQGGGYQQDNRGPPPGAYRGGYGQNQNGYNGNHHQQAVPPPGWYPPPPGFGGGFGNGPPPPPPGYMPQYPPRQAPPPGYQGQYQPQGPGQGAGFGQQRRF